MTLVLKLFVVFVAAVRPGVFCFNIENRVPVVKRGLNGSYFGFSVALHKSEDNSDIRNSWLLVGAPLGQNMQPDTNKSGTLFKCPITNFDDQTDCVEVQTDGRRLASGKYVPNDFDYEDIVVKAPTKPRAPGNDEIKDGQWMGVNVRSQGPGGKVMVCAHRYIWSRNLELNQYGLGLCYSLDNNLEWDEQWEPCKGRPMFHEHQQFGYCQAGTSLALLNDGTAVIGSPGPFTWRGTLFVLSISGDFLDRDNEIYLGPLNDKPEPINKYSYLGMSVTAGKFLYGGRVLFAAGAPRSHDHGQVYIFDKYYGKTEMNCTAIIDGEQFASNFGYEILSGDFNNDGYDDLLVSAPFYFKDKLGGGVYAYYNLRNQGSSITEFDGVLRGTLESQFGIALANLGDINHDGYNDLAVGAPYEGFGTIYIYLGGKDGIQTTHSQKLRGWEGTTTMGYSLSGGMDMDNNGYPDLLAGAYDSDVVLLFRARPIIDIKTNVTGSELKNINMDYPGCEKDPDTPHKCFSFKTCFTINTEERGIDGMTIRCDVKEVFGKGISRLWFKQEDPNIKHPYQIRHFTLNRNQAVYCQEETVYLYNNIRDILSPIKFRLNYTIANNQPHSTILNQTSINDFEATFEKDCGNDDICQSKMKMSARLLLNETTDKRYILNLGDLEEFSIEVNVTNKGDPAYEAKVFIAYPSSVRYIDIVNKTRSFKCAKKNDTIMSCDLGNPLRANRTLNLQLRFEIKAMTNQSRGSIENELEFFVFVNSTSEELSTQTKATLTALISKKAEVKLSNSYYTKTVVYSGEVRGESAIKTFEDVGSTVWHYYQVQQFGPMSSVDLIVTISWPWQVGSDKSQGKWLLYLENVTITDGRDNDYCYFEPSNALNFLNLIKPIEEVPPPDIYNKTYTSESKTKISQQTTIDHSYEITSEQLLTNSFSSANSQDNEIGDSTLQKLVRKRRETDFIVPADLVTGRDGKKRKVVTMDCNQNTAKCIKIYCEFPKFSKGRLSTVVVKSRLWNSTFVEDYSQIDWVRILSYGNISIMDPTIELDEQSHPLTFIETNAYPDLSIQLETGVPLWIIILAVVAGLILLILLVLVLWMAGFFKRNRIKDPTLSGNLMKQSEQETLLNK